MIWLGIVIGIFVMQLATFIITWATRENEHVVIPFSVFIFYPFVRLINLIIRTIKHKRWVKRQIEKLNKESAQIIEQKSKEIAVVGFQTLRQFVDWGHQQGFRRVGLDKFLDKDNNWYLPIFGPQNLVGRRFDDFIQVGAVNENLMEDLLRHIKEKK